MKKVIGAIFLALLVFSVLSLFSIGMSHYYFQTGLTSYYDAQDRDKWNNYSQNTAKAISCFEYALAFNKLGVFDKYYMYDIYYYLALNYWTISENQKANLYLKELMANESSVVDEKRRNDIELLKIRTGITVNGIMDDGWRAIVNQNLVKSGDMVNGVQIVNITPEYLEFKHNNFVFTDSVDRASPLVVSGLIDVRNLFNKAQDNGQALSLQKELLEAALLRAKTLLADYALDKPDYIYLKAKTVEIEALLNNLDRELEMARLTKKISVGMTMDDVISILGETEDTNTIIDKDEKQKWEYPDRTLYFTNTAEGWILNKVISK